MALGDPYLTVEQFRARSGSDVSGSDVSGSDDAILSAVTEGDDGAR